MISCDLQSSLSICRPSNEQNRIERETEKQIEWLQKQKENAENCREELKRSSNDVY